MNDSDSAVAIVQEQVQRAAREREPLCVTGGGTKRFLGRKPRGTPCSVRGIEGIVHYEPTELVVSCLLYTSPSPRDLSTSRMPSSA